MSTILWFILNCIYYHKCSSWSLEGVLSWMGILCDIFVPSFGSNWMYFEENQIPPLHEDCLAETLLMKECKESFVKVHVTYLTTYILGTVEGKCSVWFSHTFITHFSLLGTDAAGWYGLSPRLQTVMAALWGLWLSEDSGSEPRSKQRLHRMNHTTRKVPPHKGCYGESVLQCATPRHHGDQTWMCSVTKWQRPHIGTMLVW